MSWLTYLMKMRNYMGKLIKRPIDQHQAEVARRFYKGMMASSVMHVLQLPQ